jgi:hypothetical protein
MRPSAHALAMLQQGRFKRAWRMLLVAIARAEQPRSDAYVVVFILCLFCLILGYGWGHSVEPCR